MKYCRTRKWVFNNKQWKGNYLTFQLQFVAFWMLNDALGMETNGKFQEKEFISCLLPHLAVWTYLTRVFHFGERQVMEVSETACSHRVASTSRRTHRGHKIHVDYCAKFSHIAAVIPSWKNRKLNSSLSG